MATLETIFPCSLHILREASSELLSMDSDADSLSEPASEEPRALLAEDCFCEEIVAAPTPVPSVADGGLA